MDIMATIIGIAGGTASGKTTVAQRLVEAQKDISYVAMLRLDDYYKDLSHLPLEERRSVNFDHMDTFDFELLVADINKLKNGETIYSPVYDYVNHTRVIGEYREVKPSSVIIVEGIHALAEPTLRELYDIKIYVDTEDDIRFIRRLKRDIEDRGRTMESVIKQYLTTVRPMHLQFVEPSKRYADIIVPEGGKNEVAINILTNKISDLFKGE